MSDTDYAAIIRKLTKRQREVLGQIAINNDGGHNPQTLESLERNGLITSYPEKLTGFPPITITRYAVPIPVHIAWCEWCSRQWRRGEGRQ